MGTLLDTFTSTRLRVKDQYKNEFTDSDLLDLTNEILDQVFEELRRLESNLVLEPSSITTEEGVDTYALGNVKNITDGSVWIADIATPLQLVVEPVETELANIPRFFALTGDGQVKFYPTPNAVYTVNFMFPNSFVAPTLATLDTYDFPWLGLWNRAILRSLVLECLTILERNLGVAIAQAENAWTEAALVTYSHGRIRRTNRGRLFYGI